MHLGLPSLTDKNYHLSFVITNIYSSFVQEGSWKLSWQFAIIVSS